MTERMIEADGIELATEAFGDPAHPPVLLIMGGAGSMLWWPEAFCRRLADRGRFVIRYDNRDTGRSTTYEPGSPGYTWDDLADDAVRVLVGYGLATTHLVGLSMGGLIAQLTALKHPGRVASLTAISSSPFGEDKSKLPGFSPAYREGLERLGEPDWSDRDQVVRSYIEEARLRTGSAHPFDEAGVARIAEGEFDRAGNYVGVTNHARLTGGEAWRGRLRELRVPLLVIHGTEDPVYPIEHGVALAQAVAGASLVRLDGSGHELHEADWDEISAAIVEHTAGG